MSIINARAELVEHEDDFAIEARQVDSATALATLNRSEIDMQITTAKKYPRSISKVKKDAMELATLDEETAGTMFYTLPRAGKTLEGPSIRMAEVIGSCWGNLRYGARIVSVDPPGPKGSPQFITAQGMCHDLEKNVAIALEIRRRITNNKGERFNEDMIQVTGNAACSIALREAIFKVIPRALIKPIYDAAKLTSIGKAETLVSQRDKMLAYFAKMGVVEARVLAVIDAKGLEDVGIDELIMLRGLATAIKTGETTVDDAFGQKVAAVEKLNDVLPPVKVSKPDLAPNETLKPDGEIVELSEWDAFKKKVAETRYTKPLDTLREWVNGDDCQFSEEAKTEACALIDGRLAQVKKGK